MGMKIDSVLKNAVAGVQQGLVKAQKNSAQLAMASPGSKTEEGDSKQSSGAVQTVKSVENPDLGKFVDVEA